MEAERSLSRIYVYLVFSLALISMAIELILSRISSFFLDYSNSFFAVPIVLFGLGAGSLSVHISKKTIYEVKEGAVLLAACISAGGSFALIFFLFSKYFPYISLTHRNNVTFCKTLVFAFVFIVPFFFIGKLFSIIFAKCKKDIGSIYGADLVGAGVGCLIVPVLFHFIDLPFIIGVFLLFFCLITTFFLGRFTVKNTYILIVYLMLFVGFLVLFESSYDLAGTIRHVFQNKGAVTEISHRWNEFSRVALLKIQGRLLPQYHIIHDNGESNVGVVLKQPRFDGHSV